MLKYYLFIVMLSCVIEIGIFDSASVPHSVLTRLFNSLKKNTNTQCMIS